MSKFKFKFEVLLKLKNQLEQDAKNRLSIATKYYEECKAVLQEKQTLRIKKIDEINGNAKVGVMVFQLKEFNNFLKKIDEEIENAIEKVNISKKNVDIIKEELKTILKERQILDKLKEKELEKYNKEIIKKEQLVADEVTGYKYATRED